MELEQHIKEVGADKAPRITPDHINNVIADTYFINAGAAVEANLVSAPPGISHNPTLNQLTICILVLKNGFTVTGESACASPENFNEEIGRKIAYENAVEKIWLLEGYLLKQNLHEQAQSQEMLKGFADGDCEGCKI